MVGIAIAGICGIGAFIGMQKLTAKPQSSSSRSKQPCEVLVARSDMGLGTIARIRASVARVGAGSGSAGRHHLPRVGDREGIFRSHRSLARSASEPITRHKLIKSGEGGVLASILPEECAPSRPRSRGLGRRPPDPAERPRDVYLIRRLRAKGGGDEHTSELLFSNVRILAIGQRLESKEGQKARKATPPRSNCRRCIGEARAVEVDGRHHAGAALDC